MNKILKKTARYISLLLCLCMLIPATLAGCAVSGDDTDTADGTQASGQENAESETLDVYKELEKTNYDNREFVILSREDLKTDFYIEDGITGDILDDAVYARNVQVETDYGIKFNVIADKDYNAVNDEITKQALNSLDEYDIVIGHKYTFTSAAVNNYLINLNGVISMDLNNPWWDKACYDNLTINGKTFLMTGDILPQSMKISSCFTFNKKLMKDLKLEEPYDLVDNGGWTLDVFNALTADVTYDVNGDSVIDYQNDRFGFTTWMMDVSFSMFYGAGGMFVTVNDGEPEVTFDSETVINIYEKIYKGIIEQQAYFVTDGTLYMTTYEPFTSGRALFCDITLGKLNFLSEMTDDYGIVPVPKYDDKQKEYLSFVNGASGFIGMVSTEADTELVGTIVEAMGAYNYVNVSPNMFEICTKLKSARDPQSSHMVDYIIRNRIYDFGYFFDLGVADVIRQQLIKKSATISSELSKFVKSSPRDLKQRLKKISK